MLGRATALLLMSACSLLASTGATVTVRAKDFICCKDDSCGGQGSGNEAWSFSDCKSATNHRTDDPEFDCAAVFPGFGVLCETIICCNDPNCQGGCVEDTYPNGQCLTNQESTFNFICEQQPYQCCRNANCQTCQNERENIVYGSDPATQCASRQNRKTACPTSYCCKNPDCTACSLTGETAATCASKRGFLCAYGGVTGDPHVETWSHKWFDFHGVCDLVMLDAPQFGGIGMTVHVRTTARYEYSFVSHVVVKLGGDILEVQSFGDYAVNGVSSAQMPNQLAGFPVTHTQVNKKRHEFQIELLNGEKIVVTAFKDIVSVRFDRASSADFHGAVGLMGEFGTGTMLARDGKTILEDPVAFGKEWQVRDTEDKLFQTDRYPQYPEQCTMPGEEQKEGRRRRLGEVKSRQAAEEACAWWEPAAQERCIFDVLVSGDLEMAEAGPY